MFIQEKFTKYCTGQIYVINLDEYDEASTHWVACFVKITTQA